MYIYITLKKVYCPFDEAVLKKSSQTDHPCYSGIWTLLAMQIISKWFIDLSLSTSTLESECFGVQSHLMWSTGSICKPFWKHLIIPQWESADHLEMSHDVRVLRFGHCVDTLPQTHWNPLTPPSYSWLCLVRERGEGVSGSTAGLTSLQPAAVTKDPCQASRKVARLPIFFLPCPISLLPLSLPHSDSIVSL